MDFETATRILLDYKENNIRSTDDEIRERFNDNQIRLRAFFNECYINNDIDRLRRLKDIIIDIHRELNSGNDLKEMGLSEDNEPFFQLPLRIRKITDYSQKIGTSYLNELLKEIKSIIKLSEKEQPRKTESDKLEESEQLSFISKGERKLKITAVHYAIAFWFDCEISRNKIYNEKTQEQLESYLGNLYTDDSGVQGATIGRRFRDVREMLDNQKTTLESLGGNDCREIIIKLSKYPNELKDMILNNKE